MATTARAERALDNVWSRNLTNRRLLDQMLDDWADRGRNGTVAMREILERRPSDYVPPASNLESRFTHLARSTTSDRSAGRSTSGAKHGSVGSTSCTSDARSSSRC